MITKEQWEIIKADGGRRMTVLQLKRKLNKLPDDANVVIMNDSRYIDGMYLVTDVITWERETLVEIETDYKKRIGE